MNKRNILYLLGATVTGALATYQFMNMDGGYLWLIPVTLGLMSWYLMWLLVKQPKAKSKTVNFRKGEVLFLYDKKSA
jgi:hypothetical protein